MGNEAADAQHHALWQLAGDHGDDGSAAGGRTGWRDRTEWPDISDPGDAPRVQPLATVEVEQLSDVAVARLRGEIETSNVTEVDEALGAAATDHRRRGLVVDLSGVTYLNSATVKLLFDLAERIQQRGQQMRLVMSETAPMRKLILLLKFHLVVPLDTTIEDALAQIRKRAASDGT